MTYFRHLWIALESGYRAGLKQFRKRRTELAKAGAPLPMFPEAK